MANHQGVHGLQDILGSLCLVFAQEGMQSGSAKTRFSPSHE